MNEHRPLSGCLPEPNETLTREVLTRASSRWAYWVMRVLTDAAGPQRFSRIHEAVRGVTQKVLTQTLRNLERDGFVSRTVYPQVPPRVEYAPTDLGREFMARIEPVVAWTRTRIGDVRAAQTAFDAAAEER